MRPLKALLGFLVFVTWPVWVPLYGLCLLYTECIEVADLVLKQLRGKR